jgi:hypothetical protein
MFQRVRKHLTPATVLALVALVFAVTGGAFAASGSGGSSPVKASASTGRTASFVAAVAATKKKKPTSLRGPAGPRGATGATGPAGPAGAAGAKGENGGSGGTGPQGPQGPEGKEGKEGAKGKEGKDGPTGPTGAPWTPNNVLPEKATETGAWALSPEAETGAESGEAAMVAISFPIPLAAPLGDGGCKQSEPPCQAHLINEAGKEVDGEEAAHSKFCTGSAAKPTAEPGNLCVYVTREEKVGFSEEVGGVLTTAAATAHGVAEEGAAQPGAVLHPYVIEPGGTAWGTWAVTAE